MGNQFIILITSNLGIPTNKVKKTIELLEGGATIPFIARYRKEMTGSLDEVQIADIQSELKKLKDLEKRKETILSSIEEQGKLTPELRQRIEDCWDSTRLEDIYLPYKQKRKTRGSIAKAKGLEPLAELIFKQNNIDLSSKASQFLTNEVANVDEALAGARDIIAEWINEDQEVRNKVRFAYKREATIRSKVARNKEEEGAKFKDYFDFEEDLNKCPSHRLLAIRRGEDEGFLRVSISPDDEMTLYKLEKNVIFNDNEASQQVRLALADSYKRLLSPSIETEFRGISKEKADIEAINVFAENLRQLLLSAPLGQKRILALDPGYKTGCKLICLDESGNLLYHSTIFPHPPRSDQFGSMQEVTHLVDKYDIEAIAVGNGTASKETMQFCQSVDFGKDIQVFLVNEAGASIYSASAVAREEFPDKDVTVRGAVSIGRRLMDPLAELVKIDAKSIGVGQYQHDVNQPKLKESLDRVVESCVNSVGINLNTASKHLLTYVSGLGPTLAQNIIDYRTENGQFKSRTALKKVPRMGAKAFEQSAGFLRIRDAKNPLDNTAVHPESYHVVKQMAADVGASVQELIQEPSLQKSIDLRKYITETTGLPTLNDIVSELSKPGLDPRGKAQPFEFAKGINTINDLNVGMIVPGIITNITNFGAFVSIGIKNDGLVHISQLANRFVKNPADVVQLNQKVQVKIIDIDAKRGRVNLSMKEV